MSNTARIVILTVILTLSILSLVMLIATPFLCRRLDKEKRNLIVVLCPLWVFILIHSLPFWWAALLLLSGI